MFFKRSVKLFLVFVTLSTPGAMSKSSHKGASARQNKDMEMHMPEHSHAAATRNAAPRATTSSQAVGKAAPLAASSADGSVDSSSSLSLTRIKSIKPKSFGQLRMFEGIDTLHDKMTAIEADIKELTLKITAANGAGEFEAARNLNIQLGRHYRKIEALDASVDKKLKANLSRADGVVSRKMLGFLGRDGFCNYIEAVLSGDFVRAASLINDAQTALNKQAYKRRQLELQSTMIG